MFGTVCSLFLLTALMTAGAFARAEAGIEQVPAGAAPADGDLEAGIRARNEGATQDYQKEILSDPTYSPPARAHVESGGTGGGNTAVIVQKGGSNASSIVQMGDDNEASQTQNGNANDLRVEQYGKNNRSDEHQTGQYNHKVKIQNGSEDESWMIEQVSPSPNANPPPHP